MPKWGAKLSMALPAVTKSGVCLGTKRRCISHGSWVGYICMRVSLFTSRERLGRIVLKFVVLLDILYVRFTQFMGRRYLHVTGSTILFLSTSIRFRPFISHQASCLFSIISLIGRDTIHGNVRKKSILFCNGNIFLVLLFVPRQ